MNILSFDFEADQKFKVIKENIFKNQKVLQIEVNEEHIVTLTDNNKIQIIQVNNLDGKLKQISVAKEHSANMISLTHGTLGILLTSNLNKSAILELYSFDKGEFKLKYNNCKHDEISFVSAILFNH